MTSDDRTYVSSGVSPYDVGCAATNKDTALLTPNSQASTANLPPTLLPVNFIKASNKDHIVTASSSKTSMGKKSIKIIKGKIAVAPNARSGNAIQTSSTAGAMVPKTDLMAAYNN